MLIFFSAPPLKCCTLILCFSEVVFGLTGEWVFYNII